MSKIVIKSIANRASDQTQNLFKKGLFDRFQSWFYCQFYDARFWIFYLYSWFSLANIIHLLLLFHLLVVVVVVVDVDVVGGFPHKCELQMPPESVGTMLQNIFWIGKPRPHFVFFCSFLMTTILAQILKVFLSPYLSRKVGLHYCSLS